MADYWDRYMEASEAPDTVTKLKILAECVAQSEDELTRRVAAHDLGNIYYLGKGVPVDKERGKKWMKLSADLGHPEAMNLYGQALTHDGDTDCITYFCMALNEAQVMAAKNLNELLTACRRGGNYNICNAIEAGVGEVARLNLDNARGNDSKACLVLALIGLYELGSKCGISTYQGEEYLRKSVDLGHPIAKIISQDPNLKRPASRSYGNLQSTPPRTTSYSAPQYQTPSQPASSAPVYGTNTVTTAASSPKNRWLALILCFFLGCFGVHRFYVGKIGTGILWVLTMGFFGIGVLLDLIVILIGRFRDADGQFLK